MKKLAVLLLTAMVTVSMSAGTVFASSAPQKSGQNVKAAEKSASEEYAEGQAIVLFKTDKKMTKSSAASALKKNTGTAVSVRNLWAMKYEKEGTYKIDSKTGRKHFVTKDGGKAYANIALVKVDPKDMSTKELIRKLKSNSKVKYAEPNYRIHALAASPTREGLNDTYKDFQWNLKNSDIDAVWNGSGSGKATTGTEKIVAVVDTGIDYNHEDLKDQMWENDHYPTLKGEHGYDFINGDEDPMDDNGHGTHCAGIIGAEGNNGKGVSGVNQNVRLMALKILNSSGSASASNEIAAYEYINKAIDLGEPIVAINNSWGGGEQSKIFEKLVDIVGEKGAVTVCAAGNDGLDNDEGADYPAGIDSPYLISVAATTAENKLVSFSNYGKESVDTAAPGADILSTVCYDCYNPSIYSNLELKKLSAYYNGFDSGAFSDNGSSMMPEGHNGATCEVVSGKGFRGGSALKVTFSGGSDGQQPYVTIPYKADLSGLTEDADYPQCSLMVRAAGGQSESALLEGADMPSDGDVASFLSDSSLLDSAAKEEGDFWSHGLISCFTDITPEDLKDSQKDGKTTADRQIVLGLDETDAKCSFYIDDIGMSRVGVNSDAFGKYDFMSGTSMAAPFVSGAIALKENQISQESGKAPDAEQVIADTVDMAKSSPELKTISGGALDFGCKPAVSKPRIGQVTVAPAKKQIVISGTGLGAKGLEVWIGTSDDNGSDNNASDETMKQAEIISASDRKIVIKDQDWINNIQDIQLRLGGKTAASKSNVYMVNGKNEYSKKSDVTADGTVISDGKYFYWGDNSTGDVMKYRAGKPDNVESLGTVNAKAIFGGKKADGAQYAMQFDSMTAADGWIYSIVEYGMAWPKEEEDDFRFFFSDQKAEKTAAQQKAAGKKILSADDGTDEEEAEGIVYSGDFRLVRINAKSGKVQNLGKLPQNLRSRADTAMGAYNGKLYFLGGYDFGKDRKGFSSKVNIYDPASQKWSTGKSLPEGRAGGQAIQTGNKLVYTLGYGKDSKVENTDITAPANMVYNGSKWTKSRSSVTPLVVISDASDGTEVTRGGTAYLNTKASVGLASGGLVYCGLPAEDYGDTFLYKVNSDSYKDTGYNFIQKISESECTGAAAGSRLYAWDDEALYSLKISSGLVRVTASVKGGGTVKGAGSYLPGSTVKIRLKAKKGRKIKSVRISYVNGSGKKVRRTYRPASGSRTVTLKNVTGSASVKAVFGK